MALIDPLAVATQGYLLNDSSFLTAITMGTLGWIKIPGSIIIVPLPPEKERRRQGGSTNVAARTSLKTRKTQPEVCDDPRHYYDIVIRTALSSINNKKIEDDIEKVVRFKAVDVVPCEAPKVSKIEANKQEYLIEFKNLVHNFAPVNISGSQAIKILPISLIVSGSFVKK